jgi:hypothetical protein
VRWSLAALGLAAGLLGAGVPAQVRIATSLPDPVLDTLRAALLPRLPGVELRFSRRATAELWTAAERGEVLAADLLLGVDAQVVELLDADGLLAGLGIEVPAGLRPFLLDPAGRYLVPWADAYVVARDPGFAGAGAAPRAIADLVRGERRGQLALPGPEAAPSLFVDWIREPLRAGESLDLVFATLTALDARVEGRWAGSCAAALDALAAAPAATFAIAPVSLLRARPGPLAFDTLLPFSPLLGHACALTTEAADPAAARQVLAAALDPGLAVRLAIAHGILPGVGEDAEGAATVPGFVRELLAAAAPVDPARDHVEAWFARFEAEVRGQGRYSEELGLWLDLAFGLLFLLAVVWIFRRSQAADA